MNYHLSDTEYKLFISSICACSVLLYERWSDNLTYEKCHDNKFNHIHFQTCLGLIQCKDASTGIPIVPVYQYRNSHCGDKIILWLSYLHNGISYTGNTTSLYQISALFLFIKNNTLSYYLTAQAAHVISSTHYCEINRHTLGFISYLLHICLTHWALME